MSQKKITSFFVKRNIESNKSEEGGVKRTRVEDNGENGVDNQVKPKKLKSNIINLPSSGVANIGPSWLEALGGELTKDYYKKLSQFVQTERRNGTVYPPEDQVFTWTKMCTIKQVKVVIIGQDPYHGVAQAHGLAFSVKPPTPSPPSLVNIFKEIESDIEGFKVPMHGDLTGWAKQGVLLLNASLTVKANCANSHSNKGWEQFTDAVIAWLNANANHLVFLLWGNNAQKKGIRIDTKKHLVLKSVHPSPLSAHRGFFGCKHFSKANQYLKENGKATINWSDL